MLYGLHAADPLAAILEKNKADKDEDEDEGW